MDTTLKSVAAAPVNTKVSGYAWKALGGCAMDGFHLHILGFMLPAISADLHLTPGQASVLSNIGRGVGGFGPAVVGTLAAAHPFQMAFRLLSEIYMLDRIATFFRIPELKGRELE